MALTGVLVREGAPTFVRAAVPLPLKLIFFLETCPFSRVRVVGTVDKEQRPPLVFTHKSNSYHVPW